MGVTLPFPMHYLPPQKKLGFRQRKRHLTEIYTQKAKDAIALLYNAGKNTSTTKVTCVTKGQAVRFLSTNFAWTEQEISNSIKIKIRYKFNPDIWIIEATINNFFEKESLYEINIFPSCHYEDWGLETEQVKLCAQDLDRRVFTALWKYFEETLIKLTGKADLVQLSGYYQYKPRINGILTCRPSLKEDLFWQVVQSVVEGIGVAKQLPAKSLASQWGVKVQGVFNYLESLRGLGYEVRNHKTNPQISQGKYLIPYAFPTLMPKSVQLRKKLR